MWPGCGQDESNKGVCDPLFFQKYQTIGFLSVYFEKIVWDPSAEKSCFEPCACHRLHISTCYVRY